MLKTQDQAAIQFVSYDSQARQYSLNEEAVTILKNIQGPIAIIAVAGMYRTGKSYLLNRIILNRSNGFGVGPTVNPCTKGIWMWPFPITVPHQNGQTLNVVLLDSEGTGAVSDSDFSHDTTIFALSVLLSSAFVYNSVGAIDENAIDSLGLVVNLTKFIQLSLNRSGSADDFDPDEYSRYMPSFYWVLRDFSLQLLDSNGDSLSSTQYLEKSLQEQHGFSDDVEQKNRIRRLLTTFFPERDCFTLVRPVMKEDQLQSLDRIPVEQLRPEFVEQSMQLRKVLVSRVKAKQIKGQQVNVRSYIGAINNGATPNIENSWTYVFKEECQKGMQESLEIYEKLIKENLQCGIPTLAEDVKFQHHQSKEQAVVYFNQRSVGDNNTPYLKELKQLLKQKYTTLITLNERESQVVCHQFLIREFGPIDRKLKTGEYHTFQEYERDVKLFNQFLQEHGPRVANRHQHFSDFLHRAIQEGSGIFVKALSQESEQNKQACLEQTKTASKEIQNLKEGIEKERANFLSRTKNLETEKLELQQTEKKYIEKIRELDSKLEKNEQQFRTLLQQEKQTHFKQYEELKSKCQELEESITATERQGFLKESEYNKALALLEQKLGHKQKLLDDLMKKEKDFDVQQYQVKKDSTSQVRDLTVKFEGQTKELQQKISELNERNNELIEQLEVESQRHQVDSNKGNQKLSAFQQQIGVLQLQIQKLTQQNQAYQKENALIQEQLSQFQLSNRSHNNEENTQLKTLIKTLEDKLINQRGNWQKEKAVIDQQVQFLTLELEEKRLQVYESRKSHEQALNAIQSQTCQQTQQGSRQIVDLKEQHLTELRSLEQEHQSIKRKQQLQIDSLNKEVQETELKLVVLKGDKDKEQNEFEQKTSQYEELKVKLQQQIKDVEQSKVRQVKEMESRYQIKVGQLESEIETLKSRLQQSNQTFQSNVEEQLSELRNFYEMEKEMLEKRLKEEREKGQQRYQSMIDESELKRREDIQSYEDEIEQLKEEINSYEVQMQGMQQQMENEIELKCKQIESLDNLLLEAKSDAQNLQQKAQTQVDSVTQSLQQSIQQLEMKSQRMQEQLQQKDKDMLFITQKLANVEENLRVQNEEYEQQLIKVEKDKTYLNEKVEDQRKRNSQLCDEFLEKKITYEKLIALSTQQNEFFGRKVEELEKQLEQSNSRYEEKLKVQKQEWSDELNTQLSKINEDKVSLEQKCFILKKQTKDQEQQISRLTSSLEREQALNQEKSINLELKISEMEGSTQSELRQAQTQIQSQRESNQQQKKQFQQEIDQLRQQLHQIELDRTEMQGNYERDKVLWQGKFNFLEQQRDQVKEDHNDAIRKFELTVTQLQKSKQAAEKNESSQEFNDMLNSIEKKYQEQIHELVGQGQQKQNDYEDKIKSLQKELKQVQDKQVLDVHGKLGSQLYNERKLNDLLENEKRLSVEIDQLKEERDQMISDHSNVIDRERDQWKSRLNEVEDRMREYEKKHSQLIFFHEKERAKWNLEKDYIQQQKNDFQDQLQRLEKKKELLLRENEKFKNSSKSQRKYNPNQTYIGTNNVNNNSFVAQRSDKKVLGQSNNTNKTAFDQYSLTNISCDVNKSIEEDNNSIRKENIYSEESNAGGFSGFQKYHQMMSSRQGTPEKLSQNQPSLP